MVNVTGQRPGADTTVLLRVGDHPYLTKPSCIFYKDARYATVESLMNAFNSGMFLEDDRMDTTILTLILDGLCKSRHTPPRVKRRYGCP